MARIQAVGADIVKIATTAVDICDAARMIQVMVHCHVGDVYFLLWFFMIDVSVGIGRYVSIVSYIERSRNPSYSKLMNCTS